MKAKIWAIVIVTSIALTPFTFYEQLGLTYIDNYIEDLLEEKIDSKSNCYNPNTSSTRICPIINCQLINATCGEMKDES